MEFGLISVPACPARRKPKHQDEMVNQLLFGEKLEILKSRELWLKVRSVHDRYNGWVTRNMVTQISKTEYDRPDDFLTTDRLGLLMVNENPMYVPVGSSLPGFQDGKGQAGDLNYRCMANFIDRKSVSATTDKLLEYCMTWINAPYLWGGRTPLGIDCSGFVQLNHKLIGIDLPRDAWQQAQEGKAVHKWKEAKPGDLAFFDDKDEIVHVGILMDGGRIIHASGKVRIDTMDKKGITNTDTQKRTHQLKALRRIVDVDLTIS